MTAVSTVNPSPAAANAASSSLRFYMLDALRFFAAIGIIAWHTPQSAQLKWVPSAVGFTLAFFTIAAVFLVVRSVLRRPQRPLLDYAAARFNRIYVPFIVWSLIYFAARNLKHAKVSNQDAVRFDWSMPLSGTAHHLWYLPFIFLVCIIVFALTKLTIAAPKTRWPLIALAATSGLIVCLIPAPDFEPLGSAWYFVDRSFANFPAAAWGLAFALVYPSIAPRFWKGRAAPAAGALLIAATATLALLDWNLAWITLGGIGLMMIAVSDWRGPAVEKLAKLGALSFGVYLVHILFIEGIEAVAARRGLGKTSPLDIATFVITTVASTAVAWTLVRFRWGRWLTASA